MARDVRVLKSKERRSRSDVSEFLHQVADKIKDGHVVLRQGQEEVSLELPSAFSMNVRVKEKVKRKRGTLHKVTLQLKWYEDDASDASLELG